MNSSKVSYLFFTLSIIHIFSYSLIPASCKTLYESVYEDTLNGNIPGKQSKNLLESVCDDTRRGYKEPCLTFLQITCHSAKNYVDLANCVLDEAINHATFGQRYTSSFNKNNQPPAIQKCATTFYPVSLSSFNKAKAGLVKDPKAASHDARLAGNGPSYCADAIKAAKINNAIIDSINAFTLLHSDIAFVAARKLVKEL